AQARAGSADDGRQARLGNAGDHCSVVRIVGELVDARAGIGGDRDGAQPGAAEPGEDRLGAVVHVHEHAIAGDDATGMQAGGDPRDAPGELAIGPGHARPLERTPDQVGMVGPQAGLRLDEAADVLAGEGLETAARKTAHRRLRARRERAAAHGNGLWSKAKADQRPVKTGVRLFMNASAASRWSSVKEQRTCRAASASSEAANEPSMASFMLRLM